MLLMLCAGMLVREKMMRHDKTYSELLRLKTFDERFKYLMLKGRIGIETFGYDRYLNQMLYTSPAWKKVRQQIIIRDNGCDLGLDEYPISGKPIIHHINPISIDDVLEQNSDIFNPEYLVCVSHETHNALHYGYESYPDSLKVIERRPNDTIPWR